MSIRGKKIEQIVIEKTPLQGHVHVIAFDAMGERLFERFLFRPFWDDTYQRLCDAIERETR